MSRTRHLLQAVRMLADPVQRPRTRRALIDAIYHPPRVGVGHYQSPMNSPEDIERGLRWTAEAPGVALNEDHQVRLFGELIPLMDGVAARRYNPANTWYWPSDAAVYRAILRRFRPRRVVEVGSGFSTATLLDTAEQHLPELEVTCIEPNPGRLQSLLQPGDDVELIETPVQDVPLSVFSALDDSDILFIDSSHVGKTGSDVLWLLLHVLPVLRRGVVVHMHDIFWPFEYPEDWLRLGRNWNEVYFVQAFLCHNIAWRIELFSSWVWRVHPQLVPAELAAGMPSSSLWLRRQ